MFINLLVNVGFYELMVFIVNGAKNIKFAGLHFRFSGDNNFYGYNANPAVLQFFQSDNIEVTDCNFRHIGHTAISVKSCTNILVRLLLFYIKDIKFCWE